jgi:hypothetical protein
VVERVACACDLLAFPPLEGPVGSQLYWALWGHEEKEMHLLSRRGEKRKDGIQPLKANRRDGELQ